MAGRGARLGTAHGTVVIDDSYNANPDSVRAAIDVLAAEAEPRVLVLGDMGEVGLQGPAFHREIGAYAKERGIGTLLACGPLSREAVAAFGAGARHFDGCSSARDNGYRTEACRHECRPGRAGEARRRQPRHQHHW